MRYFPARVVPISESASFSSATPSAGQRVVESGYSTPHFGHFFICCCASITVVGRVVRLSHVEEPAKDMPQGILPQRRKGAKENAKSRSLFILCVFLCA